LQPGDVITAVDDKPMNEEGTLTQALNTAQIGQKVKVEFWRGKSRNSVSVTLTQSPPPANSNGQ
jgi:S1-C subfamily serine protease